jgi:hypothetical protein
MIKRISSHRSSSWEWRLVDHPGDGVEELVEINAAGTVFVESAEKSDIFCFNYLSVFLAAVDPIDQFEVFGVFFGGNAKVDGDVAPPLPTVVDLTEEENLRPFSTFFLSTTRKKSREDS